MLTRWATLAAVALMTVLGGVPASRADSAVEIDARVDGTLQHFYSHVPGAAELTRKARGVLVFPSIVKAGFGVGGEYGEGALRVGGVTDGYYNSVSASIGFQLGVESRSVIILFMTEDALENFRRSHGWKAGVDASVAVVTLGAGGAIDTNKITSPVVGFILDPKGLMYNLTLEGSKISRISK